MLYFHHSSKQGQRLVRRKALASTNYFQGLHRKMILQIKWKLDHSLPEEYLSQMATHIMIF